MSNEPRFKPIELHELGLARDAKKELEEIAQKHPWFVTYIFDRRVLRIIIAAAVIWIGPSLIFVREFLAWWPITFPPILAIVGLMLFIQFHRELAVETERARLKRLCREKGPDMLQVLHDPIQPFVEPLSQALDLWNGIRTDNEPSITETQNGLAYKLNLIDQDENSELFLKAKKARKELVRLLTRLNIDLKNNGPLGSECRRQFDDYHLADDIPDAEALLATMREIEEAVNKQQTELGKLQRETINDTLRPQRKKLPGHAAKERS